MGVLSKGGGKSYAVRARQVLRRLRFPETKGLIVRKTYPELLSNHIRPFFKEYPMVREWYNKAEKAIYWPNGSITEFSYLKNTDDVYTYQGREYDDIDIDEITQHEEEVFKILRSSNRTTNPVINPSMFLTGNPGGIGHQWVKRIFIDRQFTDREKPTDFAFIPAKVWDNQALIDNDPEYVERLEDLPEHLVKAYLHGDWNIFAGLAFSELTEHIHVVEPFTIDDPLARWFGGYDYGYDHPFAFTLCCITKDKTIYVTNTLRERNVDPENQAKMIQNVVGDKQIVVYAGTDAWAKRGQPMIVDQLRNYTKTIRWVKAYTDRVNGVAELRKQIAYKHTTKGKPNMYWFKNAIESFRQVAGMQYNETKPEDVMKVDADEFGNGGDDLYDSCFPGYIKIMTAGGVKPIAEVRAGDMVHTRTGKRKVMHQWSSGIRGLRLMLTSGGRVLMGTSNHPISTNGEFVRFDALRYGDKIDTWQKSSYTRESNIDATQTQKQPVTNDTTHQAGTTERGATSHFIGRYTKTTLGIFQRAITYTIKMATGIITHPKTLKPSPHLNTSPNIYDQSGSLENTLRQSGHWLSSGTNQKRGGSGTQNTPKKSTLPEPTIKKNVSSVEVSTRPNTVAALNTAQTSANHSIAETMASILFHLLANTVGLVLRLINSNRESFAQERVLFNIGTGLRARVYNIEVDKDQEYFAEGVLVHNCRYAIATYMRPKKPEKTKPAPNSGKSIIDYIKKQEKRRKLAYLP